MNSVDAWDADRYDQEHSFVWKLGAGLVDLLAPKPGEQILDLGCGTGHLTHAIAQRGVRVVGLDSSATMIKQARENFPDLEFILADARRFEFAQPFDAVFSNAALHWIHEPDAVAESVARALNSGGRFVVEFGGKGNTKEFLVGFRQAMAEASLEVEANFNPWYYPSIAEYAIILERRELAVAFARLFDRPTKLDAGEQGLRNWIKMFGGELLRQVPENAREAVIRRTEVILRPKLFRDGSWYMDYRRLQMVAYKERD